MRHFFTSASPINDVKERLDLIEVISDYIQVQQAGQNYRAVCPFHHEKTPSFMASADKQIWHCFGCGEGGDVFGFVMRMEGMEFGETLRMLAKRAGVELQPQTSKQITEGQRKERLSALLSDASRYYVQTLRSENGKTARDYLKNRHLDDRTVDDFRIGYAPDEFQALGPYLAKQGYSEQEMLQSGMVAKSKTGRMYDRFRHRVMFPIHDHLGTMVGFTGRTLDSDNKEIAKYMNTPESAIYHKGKLLYALDAAKKTIRRLGSAIIVEGQMDVITSHQNGIRNTVASSGTALTPEQLTLLKRYTSNIFFAFDADAAGQKATKKGIRVAMEQGFNIKIITPPGGKDPDECINENLDTWFAAIRDAQFVMDFYIDTLLAQTDLNHPVQRKQMVAETLEMIKHIPERIEQINYTKKVSERIGVPIQSLLEILDKHIAQSKQEKKQTNSTESTPKKAKKGNAREEIEEDIIVLMLKYPDEYKLVKRMIQGDEWKTPVGQKMYSLFRNRTNNQEGTILPMPEILIRENLSDEERHKLKVAQMRYETTGEHTMDDDKKNLHDLIKRMRTFSIRQKLKQEELRLRQAETKQNPQELNEIITNVQAITKQLSELIGTNHNS
jgi:DNA primase